MSFVSVSSSTPDRLDSAIKSDETTESAIALSQSKQRHLYQILWRTQIRIVLDVLLHTNGSLLWARGTDERWDLRFLFPEQESVSVICENWRNHGIDPSIQRVVGVSGKLGFAEMELSQCQYDTLLTAYEMDYYDVPRAATIETVAEELQVSHQALSERLRRGHRNLIQATLRESPTPLMPEH